MQGIIYIYLLNNRDIAQVDQNLYSVILELDLESFCSGMESILYVVDRMESLQTAIQETNLKEQAKKLCEVLKEISGLSVIIENNQIYIVLPNGDKKLCIENSQRRVPFHTGLRDGISRIKNTLDKIEFVCDVDAEIGFRELTAAEEIQIMSHEPMNRAVEKALRK